MNKKKILFVCLGNICRSAAAEGIFRAMTERAGLESEFEIDSAGLHSYHEGELSDPRMRKHAALRSYKLESISRPVRSSDFEYFDYILAMDHQNIQGLLRLSPESESKISLLASYCTRYDDDIVPDPYYGGEKGFEHVMDLLEDACENLLNSLR